MPQVTLREQVDTSRQILRGVLEAFVLAVSLIIYCMHVRFWPSPVQAILFAGIFGLSIFDRAVNQRLSIGLLGVSIAIPLLRYWPSLGIFWSIFVLIVTLMPVIREKHRGDFTALILVFVSPVLVALKIGFVVPLLAGFWFGRNRGARVAFLAGLFVLVAGISLAEPLTGGIFATGGGESTPLVQSYSQDRVDFSWVKETFATLEHNPRSIIEAPIFWVETQTESGMIGILQISVWSIASYATGWALSVAVRWAYILGWGSLAAGQLVVLGLYRNVQGVDIPLGQLAIHISASFICFFIILKMSGILLKTESFKDLPCHQPGDFRKDIRESCMWCSKAVDRAFGSIANHYNVLNRMFISLLLGWFAWRTTSAFSYFETSYQLSIVMTIAVIGFVGMRLGLFLTIAGLLLLCLTQSLSWGLLAAIFGLLLLPTLYLISPNNTGKYTILCILVMVLLAPLNLVPSIVLTFVLLTNKQVHGPISMSLVFVLCWLAAVAIGHAGDGTFGVFIWDESKIDIARLDLPSNEQKYQFEELKEEIQVNLEAILEEALTLLSQLLRAFLGAPLFQSLLWFSASSAVLYIHQGKSNDGARTALLLFFGSLVFYLTYWMMRKFLNNNFNLTLYSVVKSSFLNAILGWVTWRFWVAQKFLARS